MKKKIFLLAAAILMAASIYAQQPRRWYVDCSRTTVMKDTAISWATAENDLQAVINTRSKTGDEIWVRGFTKDQISANPDWVYRPAQFSIDSTQYYAITRPSIHDPNDPYKYQDFDSKRKTLKIYGGFRGDEVTLADRKHWREYRSVLKNQLPVQPSTTTNPGGLIDINGSDNTILDGFVIEKNYTTHGMIWVGGSGTQVLANLIIRENTSDGEAILCSEAGSSGSLTKLFNVEFAYNSFSTNSSLISNYLSSMELYNVTIACNNVRGMSTPAFKVNSANLRIYNSIIWRTGGYNYTGGSASLTNCMVETAYQAALPAGVTQTNVIAAANPGFVSLNPMMPTGDFRLTANSPAVDAGDYFLYDGAYYPYTYPPFASAYTDFWARDLDGLTRWEGNEIDLGAYEYGGQIFRAPPSDARKEIESKSALLSKELILYPTSVHAQGTVYLENAGDHAVVRVYSLGGACISTQSVADGVASITAPDNTGIYMVHVTAPDGNTLYKGKLVVTP